MNCNRPPLAATVPSAVVLLLIAAMLSTIAGLRYSAVAAADPVILVTVTTSVVSGSNQAIFTATAAGAPTPGVDIYVNGVLSGSTDVAAGRYIAVGLTTDTHTWEARLAGVQVGSGQFTFFGYSLVASGTRSPALGFNYRVTASGTQTFYDVPHEARAIVEVSGVNSGEQRTWFHIDHTQVVRLTYYHDLRGGGYAYWSDGGERCVNPAVGEYQTLTAGDWYIYAAAGSGLFGSAYVKVYASFTSGRTVPWSESAGGSGSVSAADGLKYITTSSLNAPNGDTVWSVSDDNPNVNTQMQGNRVYANTTYTAPWSQTEYGTGSVTNQDVDRLVATSALQAPNLDTQYALSSITIAGQTVRDQDPADTDHNTNAIAFRSVNVWMRGKELHASMAYHPPAAFIDSIAPQLAQAGDSIAFRGHGTDPDPGDTITAYNWRSHKDGQLSTQPSFSAILSPGRHVVFFQVADSTLNTPLWSPEATGSLRVNKSPAAHIVAIRGDGVDASGYPTLVLGNPMVFHANGIDSDGYITAYEWRSTTSGLLSTASSFSVTDLPIGHRTISLRVKDNDGAWSREVTQVITVRRTPVIYVGGWHCEPHIVEWRLDTSGCRNIDISRNYERLDPDSTPDGGNLRFEHGNQSVTYLASVLAGEIQELKRQTGARRVDIVAHSMGGLISRWYAAMGYQDVRKLVILGSPQHGSDWAYLSTGGLAAIGGEAAADMTPHSPFLRSLNNSNACASTRGRGTDYLNPGTQYYAIAAVEYFYPTTLEHKHLELNLLGLLHIDIQLPGVGLGDFIVASESVRLDNAPLTYVPWQGGFWEVHVNMAYPDKRPDVWARVHQILRDPALAGQPLVEAAAAVPQAQATLPQTVVYPSEPSLGTLSPGAAASHAITVDLTTGTAGFQVAAECQLDTVLVSPDGTPIDPAGPGVQFHQEAGLTRYEVVSPAPGQWTLHISRPSADTGECHYYVQLLAETDLFAGVATGKDEYQPDEAMTIYGYVQDRGQAKAGARVNAAIQRPDATVETVDLFDDGAHNDGAANDGIYAGDYLNTAQTGGYPVTVTAEVVRDGITYHRSFSMVAWVESYPDLAIAESDITFSNAHPTAGDTIQIGATVHNWGSVDAIQVPVLFFDGDPAGGALPIETRMADVPAGGGVTLSVPWQALRGTHAITVKISPLHALLEASYDNNQASASITVATATLTADAGPDQVTLIDTPVYFDAGRSTGADMDMVYTWDVNTAIDSDGNGVPDDDADLSGPNTVLQAGYPTAGTYTVRLTISDPASDAVAYDTLTVDATADYDMEPPAAVAGPAQTVRLRQPVAFDASASHDNYGVATYLWDTDTSVDSDYDGISDNDIDLTGVHPVLSNGYARSGSHTVKLTVDDVAGNGPVEDTLTVSVTNSPLAVMLASFAAEPQANHVEVTWETVSELDNAGFNLYRASAPDGADRALLTYVPSPSPGSTQGSAYSYDDETVLAGAEYWYWLEDIDLSGAATLHGPVSAILQAPSAVTLTEAGAVPVKAFSFAEQPP